MVTKNFYPDIICLMQNINAGRQKVEEVDWNRELLYIMSLMETIPEENHFILWLWGFLGIVDDHSVRIDILEEMSRDLFAESGAGKSVDGSVFFAAYASLVAVERRICQLGNDHLPSWGKGINENFRCLFYLLSDEEVSGEYMVALAHQIYLLRCQNKKEPLLVTILGAFNDYESHCFSDMLNFIEYLLKAETYRQLILNRKNVFADMPEVRNVPRKVRNRCFDVYIGLAKKSVERELDADDTRLEEPRESECYTRLLELSVQVKDFCATYNDHDWYPDKESVFKMADLFIKYLQLQISKSEITENPGTTVIKPVLNINAPVGTVIGNVEQLNTNKP